MDVENGLQKKSLDMTKDDFRQLINMSECGMLLVRMQSDLEILYANDYFYKNLQYSREEYAEQFGNMVLGPVLSEEKQKIKALISRQLVLGGNIHLEFRAARKDGSIVWMSFTASRDVSHGEQVYFCSCLDVSSAKRHLEDVYKAKRELDLIANSIPGGVIKLRMKDFQLLYANDGYFRLAGYSRSEFSMKFHNQGNSTIYPDDVDMVNHLVKQAVDNHGPLGMEYRIVSKNGGIRWSYVNGTRIDDEHGDDVYLCVIMDITSRKQAEEELADNNHRSEVITEMLKETIWTYNIKSKTLHRGGNLGGTYSPETVLEEQFSDSSVKKFIHPDDVERFIQARNTWLEDVGESHDIFRTLNSDTGIYQQVEIRARSEAKSGGKPEKVYGITRIVMDNNAPMRLEEQMVEEENVNRIDGKLVQIAGTVQAEAVDNITGLLPYATFLKKAECVMAEKRGDGQFALICADINEFSSFSHHYGFYISNRILKTFSDVLLTNLAKDGMCARVDGDYFVVLFQFNNHKELVKALSSVVRHQGEMEKDEDFIEFGTTVGVYLVQEEDREVLGMLEKADLARRSIKGLVGKHYAIYTEEVAKQLSKEDEMIIEVRRAMSDQCVEINYLPRIRDNKDNIIGCKAIPRIMMKDGQYLEYRHIMHLMERGAQLEEFGFYVLQAVADNIGAWKAKGNDVIPVSVEMTAGQLSTKYAVKRIHDMVTKNRLLPQDFIFEIPERFFSDGTTAFEMAIHSLRELGYRVLISRFGADHTAVNSLRRLPVSGIKFHGEYFSEHMINEKDTVVLRKIVEMAEEMGMTVTCGGIRTQLQEEYAKKIGCHVFEGDEYFGAVKNVVFEKCFLS